MHTVSHLLQMRGLKQAAKDLKRQEVYVASFTDAWIETFGEALGNFGMESHLLQMRGLKPRGKYQNHLSKCRIFYRCVD